MASGKVIKGDSTAGAVPASERLAPRSPRPGVMNAEVYEAHQTAQHLLEEAQRERERLLAEAQKEREEVLARAREQGRQEGLAQATEFILRARLQAGQVLAQHERDIVALALKVAERILGRDVERQPELLMDLCASAIEQVRNARTVVLRVHPGTAAVLRARKAELMALIGRAVDVAIREDAEVEPAGCVVQTELGTVDAQLSTQLEMLQSVLLPEEGRREGAP